MTGDAKDNEVSVGLRGGIQVSPRLLVGVELAGWTIRNQSSDSIYNGGTLPAGGETISTQFLIAQVYPLADSPLFIRGGGGRVVDKNETSGEGGATGSGGNIGIGYDFRMKPGGWVYLTPSLEYSSGSFKGATSPPGVVQDVHVRALSIRIGFTFR